MNGDYSSLVQDNENEVPGSSNDYQCVDNCTNCIDARKLSTFVGCIDNCINCVNVYTTSAGNVCVDNCPNCQELGVSESRRIDSDYVYSEPHSEIDDYHDVKRNIGCTIGEHKEIIDHYCCNYDLAPESVILEGKLNPYSGYTPVVFTPELEHFPEFFHNSHLVGGYPSQMNAKAWIFELQFENDAWLKSYLLNGIIYGFDIVDDPEVVSSYDRSNYRSVLSGPAGNFVNDLIHKELLENKYVRTEIRPKSSWSY